MLLFAYEKSLVAENFSQLINGMRNLAHTKSRLACDKCLPAAQWGHQHSAECESIGLSDPVHQNSHFLWGCISLPGWKPKTPHGKNVLNMSCPSWISDKIFYCGKKSCHRISDITDLTMDDWCQVMFRDLSRCLIWMNVLLEECFQLVVIVWQALLNNAAPAPKVEFTVYPKKKQHQTS